MAITVNANPGTIKSFNNPGRVGHLLSLAVSKMSGAGSLKSGREGSAGLETERGFFNNTLEKKDLSSNQLVDQMLASPGGWARMGSLGGNSRDAQKSEPENLGSTVQQATQDIMETPITALESQAHLSPESVIKLLE